MSRKRFTIALLEWDVFYYDVEADSSITVDEMMITGETRAHQVGKE